MKSKESKQQIFSKEVIKDESTKTHANTVLSIKEDEMVELSSFVERRQHPRYSVKLPLDLWQTPDVVLGGVVTDMSEVGLGFRSTHEIQISVDLGIRVYLSRGDFHFDSIEGTGRIIWRTAHREKDWKGYRYGIYILRMALYSRDRLMKYIQMLEEEETSSNLRGRSDKL